jgi:ligand-binding sensor domain-containing protein
MKKISARGSQLKKRLKLFLALAFLLIAVRASWAAEQSKKLRAGWGDFLHQIWNTADGLPQSTVYAILQTRDNFYWLGTDGGLARFDGQRFAYFTRENTPVLTDNSITALYEDQEGDLWIGTYAGSLLRRHGQDFSLIFPGKENISGLPIWTLAGDGQGGATTSCRTNASWP